MLPLHVKPRIVVIGAGIVGAATAFFLRDVAEVTIVEAEAPAAGATGASDGAVSVASKRPGPLMRLAQQARALYGELAAQGILAGAFHVRPTFLFARNAEELEVLAQHERDLASEGEATVPLTRTELVDRLGSLGGLVLGGLAVPADGHAIGYEVTARLLAAARATVVRGTPVRGLVLDGGRVVGVAAGTGRFDADLVVIAAGLGSGPLAGLAEVLIPRKGQLIVTDRAVANGQALPGPLMSARYLAAKRGGALDKLRIGLVIDPLRTGQFLIGGSREDHLGDRKTDARTVAAILREALEVFPSLADRRVLRTFAGVRTATRDGLPIVGHHPLADNLIVATGFEGDGICLGPFVGSLVADLVQGKAPAADIGWLAPARFAPQELAA